MSVYNEPDVERGGRALARLSGQSCMMVIKPQEDALQATIDTPALKVITRANYEEGDMEKDAWLADVFIEQYVNACFAKALEVSQSTYFRDNALLMKQYNIGARPLLDGLANPSTLDSLFGKYQGSLNNPVSPRLSRELSISSLAQSKEMLVKVMGFALSRVKTAIIEHQAKTESEKTFKPEQYKSKLPKTTLSDVGGEGALYRQIPKEQVEATALLLISNAGVDSRLQGKDRTEQRSERGLENITDALNQKKLARALLLQARHSARIACDLITD